MGLITLGIAGAVGIVGHMKSRDYVRRKLRFTTIVDKPGIGVAAGAATAIGLAALPVVTMGLPVILVGAGVGTGVAFGAKDARGNRLGD